MSRDSALGRGVAKAARAEPALPAQRAQAEPAEPAQRLEAEPAEPAEQRTASAESRVPSPEPHVTGTAIVYRLYDVGYEVRLDRALDLLASSAPARVRPVRGEAQAIQIANPPITVILGSEVIVAADRRFDAEVSARIFDFGVVSLRLRIAPATRLPWAEWARVGNALDEGVDLAPLFGHHLRLLLERIAPAIERPAVAPVTEDYIVFRIDALTDVRGERLPPGVLRDDDVIPLLLNERHSLSADARRELLPHRFSYYTDDLAILTWNNALVVEPSAGDTDVQYVLEFANAQLLELRVYDALLDAELPKMYDRVAAARVGARALLRRRYGPLLTDLQTLVADSTELVERAENSLKVTDDVYMARIYTAALEIFRARVWRGGIDRKLAIIRDTYSMLNAESQAVRAEALEAAIVVLIVLEIVVAFVVR